jgi:putative ABC transport system substrate-binding protein
MGLVALLSVSVSASASTPLTVIAPETALKEESVFHSILNSMGENKEATITTVYIDKQTKAKTIKPQLKEQSPKAIVALGQTAYSLGKTLDSDIPVIAGAINLAPNGISGVSLVAEPSQLIDRLRQLSPETKRISIIYSERINGWWVQQAADYARSIGYEFNPVVVKDLREGVQAYRQVLAKAENNTDAIWLPLIDVIPSKTIMPMVLKTAWEKHIVVFSNNPSHTKLGALFALYPNNNTIGSQIIDYSLRYLKGEATHVEPAKDLSTAINIRTARHLGILLKEEVIAGYDRVYPVK